MKSSLTPVVAQVLVGCLAVSACSSAPRPFQPTIAPPPADPAAYSAAYDRCREQVAAARPGAFKDGRLKSGGGGAAVGYGAAAGLGAGGTYAGAALAMGGLIVLTPLAIYGISRAERARKEKQVKGLMADCLERAGYHVQDWVLVKPERH